MHGLAADDTLAWNSKMMGPEKYCEASQCQTFIHQYES